MSSTASTPVNPRPTRRPGLFLALLPVISMMALLALGYVTFGLPAEPLIILSALIAGGIAMYLGHTYDQILGSISDKLAKTMPALLILVVVGLMIGAWMAGGTIPMVIYWGLDIINPQYMYVTALVVTSIVAVCTGTSWGSAGTIGVAFMGVAMGMEGVNPAIVAGAVVCGAYFGDKLSPLSDTTNLASAAVKVNLYTHIKHLLWTTGPSWLLALVLFFILGMNAGGGGVTSPKVDEIMGALDAGFTFNWWLLVPILVVLVGSMRGLPTIPVMLAASALGMINAVLFQGVSVADTFAAVTSGFDTTMITTAGFDPEASADLLRLLNRGGMASMMSTLLIAFCAISFAGVISISGSLEVIIERLLRRVRSTGSLILTTVVVTLTTIATTCNGQISVLLPGEVLRPAYIRRGLHPKNLSRTVEDAGTIIEPILPWTAAGAYMAGTLGVATLSYLPFAFLNWTGILFALLWGFTGIGIARLSAEEQAQLLAEDGLTSDLAASVRTEAVPT